MAFSVVCISHSDGSGGAEVGRHVAGRLGFRYVDEQLIADAARRAQVDPAVVAATEQNQSLLGRILDALAEAQDTLGPTVIAGGIAVPPVPLPLPRRASREDLRAMIRAAIHEVARTGSAVIVAHAASLAMAGRPGVLRVLVTASDATRGRRIADEQDISDEEALELVAKGDKGRRQYIRSFYGVDKELPTHYDLVLNTDALTPEQVAEIVVAAARG